MSVFLGWMPDAATQAALAAMQRRIREALPADAPRHDWRMPAQLHMTLRYLGQSIDQGQRTRLDTAMSAFATDTVATEALIEGVHYWPHARVLVARLAASDALKAQLEQLEGAMQSCGFTECPEQVAHITLAYLANSDAPPQPALAWAPVPLHVDRVDLLQTIPGAYRSLASWPLAASGGA